MSDYPSSSLAYPLLNQLLDSLLPSPVSSTSSTFTLSTMDTSLSVTSSSSDTSLSVASSSSSSSVSSTPTIQPPLSSLVTTTTLQPPLSSLATTTPSLQIPVISSLPHPTLLPISTIPLHPHDAVATSPNLQQFSAVRQLTHDLQIKKPRHPKRPQLSNGNGPPVRRLVHTVVYKQKLSQYINALKMYEKHLDELIYQTTLQLDIINNKLPPSKLRTFNSPPFTNRPLSPLTIQIPPHNCSHYNNYIQCTTPHCSHVPVKYTCHSPLPPLSLSPALIPIRIEPITPPSQSPTPLNDLDNLVTSLNDVD